MVSLETTRSIVNFRDAVGLALQIADEYALANAVAVVDRVGRCRSVVLSSGVGRPAVPLLRWLTHRAGQPADLLMISVGPCDPSVVRERDLGRYRRAANTAALGGLGLLDWIETDGDVVRSYAYLVHPATAWPDDPPSWRVEDARPDAQPEGPP